MLAGFQKTTLVNFPHRVASAVFLRGCNMRCPYCHNPELVLPNDNNYTDGKNENAFFELEEIYSFLEKRKNVISALVISGGEPFLSSALFEIIAQAKKFSLKVKIDTNGFFPDKLLRVLSTEDLKPDMIALDVKTSPERYNELFPKIPVFEFEKLKNKFLKTLEILREYQKKIDVEYRTVLVPNLVSEKEIKTIAAYLPHEAVWRLADFVPGHCLNDEWNSIKPYTIEKLHQLLETAVKIIPNTELR